MSAHAPIRILVTGEYEDLDSRFPAELGHNGNPLEWVPMAVLRFERLPIDPDIVKSLVDNPMDWIFFTSQRSVHFWAEVLMEQGLDFPLETQVACIGEKTAEAANRDGFTPDFYPTEPGTEKFLEEFEDLLGNNSVKPKIFIPMAEEARTTIRDRLRELGCEVTTAALYRTLPREDLTQVMTQAEIEKLHLILFTSPSSVDAFTRCFSISDDTIVASLGKFTADYLTQKGYRGHRVLPEGDFERIGELL